MRRFKPLPPCLSQKQRDNLWAGVLRQQAHECWPWQRSLGVSGYPAVWVNSIEYCATRIAYLDYYGQQPGEQMVCHSCDNPVCMNPNHFFLGNHDDNMADRQRKGRQYKGERHHRAILTEQDAIEIFNLKGKETCTSIAARKNCSRSAVKAIWQGVNWSHVTGKVKN